MHNVPRGTLARFAHWQRLIVVEGARAWAAWIATGPASSCRTCRRARGGAFRGDRERGELRRQLLALALRALCLLAAVDQRFEGMIALFADVLENRHGSSRRRGTKPLLYLKSECGGHANAISAGGLRAAPLHARGASPDAGRIFLAPPRQTARSRKALGG